MSKKAVLVIALTLAGFVSALWWIGLFDFSGTEATAKIIVATLALSGVLISSMLSVVGVMLKHSIDQRNSDLNEQAEKRLQLEAAIQAVRLFSTSEGKPVPLVQKAGALFALASLERYELSTVLTGQLLAAGELDARSAARLLNRALLYGEEGVQHDAIMTLHEFVDRMLEPGGITEFPDCLMDWDVSLSEYVREWAVTTLGRLMTARPLAEWNSEQAYAILASLGLAWKTEPSDRIKNEAGATLNSMLPAFPNVGTLHHPKQTLDMPSIREEVSSLSPSTSYGSAVVAQITKWREAAG